MNAYVFKTKNTDHECHVEMTAPTGRCMKRRFRSGYIDAKITASEWIALQIQVIETECQLANLVCPDIYVDDVQVVSSNPPTMRECVDVLRRIAAEVQQRGPDSGALFEAACDAESLVERYESSVCGKFIPKDTVK